MADPTVRATATNDASGSGAICGKPTGTADGDVLVAFVATSDASPGNPGGWNLLYGPTAVGTHYISIWSKVAAGEPPAGWTWPTGAGAYIVLVAAIQDCTSAIPAASAGQVNAASTNLTAPSISPGVPNTILLGSFLIDNGATSLVPDAAMVEDRDTLHGSFRSQMTHQSLASSAATGTRISVAGPSNGINSGWLGAFPGINSVVAGAQRAEPFFWSP